MKRKGARSFVLSFWALRIAWDGAPVVVHALTSSPPPPPKIIFSDVDGTLLHYPSPDELVEWAAAADNDANGNTLLALPPSATGLKGVISSKTLAKCRDLRKAGVPLVLISGMRTSTLLNRLPYLPKADAYCTEAGGRIFYPIQQPDDDGFLSYQPLEYSGALATDLEAFGLREDVTWRQRLEDEQAAGVEAYAGNEVSSIRCINDEDSEDEECLIDYENPYGFPKQEDVIPIRERSGGLWEFARQLETEYGLVLDTKSYSTCFRVNKKFQSEEGKDIFRRLLNGDLTLPAKLEKSTNLGCIDIYPIFSGKRNCCKYIADRMGIDLSTESVCICDDDNDVEMALACSHAYVPLLSSESMKKTLEQNPAKFTATCQEGLTATMATEAALEMIYDQVRVASKKT